MDMDSPIRTRMCRLARAVDERAVRALARRSGHRRPRAGRVLVVAPANEGSIGDEAMIQSIASHLRSAGARQVGLLGFSSAAEWGGVADVDRHERLPGGLVHFGLKERAALARLSKDYDATVLIGADVLDGHYAVAKSRRRLAIAESLASWGLQVCIAGFSLNERVDPACHSDLRRLATKAALYLRDPQSFARLDVPGTNKRLAADAAFLLAPRATCELERDLIEELSAAHDRGTEFFACNLNEQVYAGAGPAVIERHLQAVAAAISALSASHAGLRVLLVPHDRRRQHDDSAALRRLQSLLRDRGVGDARLLPSGLSAPATKMVAGFCGAALTGRMHFAIACLGMGVPVLALPYQGKFEGLFAHFRIGDSVVDPAEALEADLLAPRLARLWERRDTLAAQVSARLGDVRAMAGAFGEWVLE